MGCPAPHAHSALRYANLINSSILWCYSSLAALSASKLRGMIWFPVGSANFGWRIKRISVGRFIPQIILPRHLCWLSLWNKWISSVLWIWPFPPLLVGSVCVLTTPFSQEERHKLEPFLGNPCSSLWHFGEEKTFLTRAQNNGVAVPQMQLWLCVTPAPMENNLVDIVLMRAFISDGGSFSAGLGFSVICGWYTKGNVLLFPSFCSRGRMWAQRTFFLV